MAPLCFGDGGGVEAGGVVGAEQRKVWVVGEGQVEQ
jgi:hypothetical protein